MQESGFNRPPFGILGLVPKRQIQFSRLRAETSKRKDTRAARTLMLVHGEDGRNRATLGRPSRTRLPHDVKPKLALIAKRKYSSSVGETRCFEEVFASNIASNCVLCMAGKK